MLARGAGDSKLSYWVNKIRADAEEPISVAVLLRVRCGGALPGKPEEVKQWLDHSRACVINAYGAYVPVCDISGQSAGLKSTTLNDVAWLSHNYGFQIAICDGGEVYLASVTDRAE